MEDTVSRSEFEIVRKASRLFEDAARVWETRALKAEALLEQEREMYQRLLRQMAIAP